MPVDVRSFFRGRGRRPKKVRRIAVRRARVGPIRNPVHYFKRIAYTDAWTTLAPGTAPTFGALTFSLSSLPSATDFTDLYDAYRISKVKVEIIPRVDSTDMSSQVQMPMVHSAIDLTDSNAPASLGELMEYENVRTTRGTRIHKRYFTPKVQQQVYNGLVGTGYSVDRRNKFIATDNPAVPHYALKYALGPVTTGGGNQVTFALRVTYYFQCRETK